MKVGRLQIGRQSPADVALLARNLEHWPEFLETTKDFRTVILETRSAPIPIVSLWTVLSTMVRQSVSVGMGFVCCIVKGIQCEGSLRH